jgi:hypothetical protein
MHKKSVILNYKYFYKLLTEILAEPNSWASKETGLRLDDQVSILDRCKDSLSLLNNFWGPPSLLYNEHRKLFSRR